MKTRRSTLFTACSYTNNRANGVIKSKDDVNGLFHSFEKAKEAALEAVESYGRGTVAFVYKVIYSISKVGYNRFEPVIPYLAKIENNEDGFIYVYGNF